MTKLKNLIRESTINRVEDISRDEIIVGVHGLERIKSKLAQINKNAVKWGLPEVKIEIIKEEDIKITNKGGGLDQYKKRYTVKIDGKSPRIEGYEFIAKIEHTDAGNLINISPDSSIKNLPAEYRDADAKCDVCNSKRDRLNTFIIKDEANNKLKMVGSGCLNRFLPIDSVNKIIHYADMLEELRQLEDIDDDVGNEMGHGSRNYFEVSKLIKGLALAYLVNGSRYISKKKSSEVSDTTGAYIQSTADLASNILFYISGNSNDEPDYISRAETMQSDGDKLGDEIIAWMKTYDFKADAERKPEMANYFNNLDVLSKSNTTNLKNLGYLGGLLASYLINKDMIKKKETQANIKPSEYVGSIGEKITFEATLKKISGYASQYGYVTIYKFEDDNNTRYTWFSSGNIGIEENTKYKIIATVKDHKQGDIKYGGHKENILTRAKVKTMSGEKINEIERHLNYTEYFE